MLSYHLLLKTIALYSNSLLRIHWLSSICLHFFFVQFLESLDKTSCIVKHHKSALYTLKHFLPFLVNCLVCKVFLFLFRILSLSSSVTPIPLLSFSQLINRGTPISFLLTQNVSITPWRFWLMTQKLVPRRVAFQVLEQKSGKTTDLCRSQ